MPDIALVSADFGGIDDIKPLPDHPGIDAFCFTDRETRARTSPEVARTWTDIVIPDYPRSDFSPRLRSRYFKHQIHRITGMHRYRWLAWIDASLQLHDSRFIVRWSERLTPLQPTHRVMLVPHPARQTVLQEYEYISGRLVAGDEYLHDRYGEENMDGQMASYRAEGRNLDAKLWCGGLWMIENNDPIRRCWDDWWDANIRFGLMDQLSLPVMMEKHGIVPNALDVVLWHNEHFEHVPHPLRS